MKQNKKIKLIERVGALLLCMVAVISCIVIAPSADTYDDNCTHYWYYFNYTDRPTFNETYAGFDLKYYYNSPTNQKLTFIYGKDANGNNLFSHYLFKEVTIRFASTWYGEDGHDYQNYNMYLFFGYDNISKPNFPSTDYARISYWWTDGVLEDITIEVYGMIGTGYKVFHWLPSYGNYNLQLWLNPSALVDIECNDWGRNYSSANDFIDSMFRRSIISYPKTYTEGYNSGYIAGNDFGYEQGYGDGYDQGNIDGIQHGIQQGITEGYNQGFDIGYSDGYDDGSLAGWESGKDYGFIYGYDEARKVYDTTNAWADMKNLIFAIFDAPFYVISYSLDFDLFGINIAGTLIALISTALIVWILKIIIAKLF